MRICKYMICLMLVVVLAGCTGTKIKFGTAGVGGNYYVFGQAYTELASQDHGEIEFEVKKTAGSDANLRLLSQGYLQMAIAQMDAIALSDLSGFKAVASLYTEYVQVIARDEGITSINDLKGKVVSIGEAESGTARNANHVLQAHGLTGRLVTTKNMTYSDAAAALMDGSIDAMFITSGAQTTVVESLTKEGMHLVPINSSVIENLIEAYPFYAKAMIPSGTYSNQSEDIPTIGISAVLIASDKLSSDTVKKLTESLFAHANDLKVTVLAIKELNEENAVKNISIEFHPGALAYYQEKGVK